MKYLLAKTFQPLFKFQLLLTIIYYYYNFLIFNFDPLKPKEKNDKDVLTKFSLITSIYNYDDIIFNEYFAKIILLFNTIYNNTKI